MQTISTDELSKEFQESFNKINGTNMEGKEIGLFLRNYLQLVDAYIGYIERVSTLKYFDCYEINDYSTWGGNN